MELRITVQYHNNPRTGAGGLRAKGGGRQATIGYPHELHHTMKYWEAAERLADRLERKNGYNLRLVKREFRDAYRSDLSTEAFIFEVFDQTVPRFANRDAVWFDRLPARYANRLAG